MIIIAYNESPNYRPDAEYLFTRMIDRIGSDGPGEPPLRDALSRNYLQKVCKARVLEDDWYSLVYEDGRRTAMFCLPREDKYVLMAMRVSRKTPPAHLLLEPLDAKRWHLLAKLPFDIHLTASPSDFVELREDVTGKEPCQITDYPYYGKAISVTVLPGNIAEDYETDRFTHLPEQRDYVPEYALYTDLDGVFYTDCEMLRCSARHSWMKNISNTIRKLETDRRWNHCWNLTDVTRAWTMEEFAKQLHFQADFPERIYRHLLATFQTRPEHFRIVTHMEAVPILKKKSSVVSLLRISKAGEQASPFLQEGTTAWCGFEALVREVLLQQSPGQEEWILVLEGTEEPHYGFDYINNGICGFHVSPGRLEIYDRFEAAKMFADALRDFSQDHTIS
ncbi:MAG: hypothetical protein LUF27_16195 [Lachnospiraceae bacterium]|nr:hypothetical protein [Lachnospiraceae bacterium]